MKMSSSSRLFSICQARRLSNLCVGSAGGGFKVENGGGSAGELGFSGRMMKSTSETSLVLGLV